MANQSNGIGTLNESSLHAQIKELLVEPGDELEVPLNGFVIDIRRGGLLIEVQTQSFASMARKLDSLLDRYDIRIVHPIAVVTYLVRPNRSRRRSPKRGDLYSVLDELVSIPTLLDHPRLTLELILVDIDRHQVHDPKARRGRGGWRTIDKSIAAVHGHHRLGSSRDMLNLLPPGLPPVFTTADIADTGTTSRDGAQKLAYVLRSLGLIELIEADRRGYRYRLSRPTQTGH
ncbi:MAG: hypothetical protein OER95_17950 [Acidimicrobiia bacterium]|nr:hypothetical protein [Acidimicrobiia bacterium]